MKIFAGTASSSLSERICAHLGTACGNAAVTHFEDGEIRVQFQENIRGKDVFLVNSTSPPVNDHLIELLILIDAARRASAARITAVLPYFGYARQDRKDRPASRSPRSWSRTSLWPRARPRADGGPPLRPDSGLFRHSGGPPQQRDCVHAPFPAAAPLGRSRRGLAGHGQRAPHPPVCQPPRRRRWRSSTSGARRPMSRKS